MSSSRDSWKGKGPPPNTKPKPNERDPLPGLQPTAHSSAASLPADREMWKAEEPYQLVDIPGVKESLLEPQAAELLATLQLRDGEERGYTFRRRILEAIDTLKLRDLCLSRCGLDDDLLLRLCQGMLGASRKVSNSVQLAELDVSYNKLGPVGACGLSLWLQQDTWLRTLNVGACPIGVGFGAILRALQHNETLATLIAHDCDIRAEGALALAEVTRRIDFLSCHHSLTPTLLPPFTLPLLTALGHECTVWAGFYSRRQCM